LPGSELPVLCFFFSLRVSKFQPPVRLFLIYQSFAKATAKLSMQLSCFPSFLQSPDYCVIYLLCVTLKRFLEAVSCLKQWCICVALVCPNNWYLWILFTFNILLQYNYFCCVGHMYQSSSSIFSGNILSSLLLLLLLFIVFSRQRGCKRTWVVRFTSLTRCTNSFYSQPPNH
jgi:hypothetical protein